MLLCFQNLRFHLHFKFSFPPQASASGLNFDLAHHIESLCFIICCPCNACGGVFAFLSGTCFGLSVVRLTVVLIQMNLVCSLPSCVCTSSRYIHTCHSLFSICQWCCFRWVWVGFHSRHKDFSSLFPDKFQFSIFRLFAAHFHLLGSLTFPVLLVFFGLFCHF